MGNNGWSILWQGFYTLFENVSTPPGPLKGVVDRSMAMLGTARVIHERQISAEREKSEGERGQLRIDAN